MGEFIKTYEAWGGKALPIIPYDLVVNYYKCDEDHVYETPKKLNSCSFCGAKLHKISKSEFYEKVKERLDDEEWEDFLNDQEEQSKDIVDLRFFANKNNNI